MSTLPHRLDRTVVIRARPATVFRFLTDTPRWAAWWGAGSSIDARPGGRVVIRYPNGVEVAGEVIEVHAPERIVFTYGFVSGTPLPAGSSRVTITLVADPAGTHLHLAHEFADAAVRDEHGQGWRYQLSLFSNIVSDEINAGAASLADAWFDAWADPDASRRDQLLADAARPDITFRDRFSNIAGLTELRAHIAAAQRFMPGIRLHRIGNPRQCQGTVLVDWEMRTADGQVRGRGTNVHECDADGRFISVTGVAAGA